MPLRTTVLNSLTNEGRLTNEVNNSGQNTKGNFLYGRTLITETNQCLKHLKLPTFTSL